MSFGENLRAAREKRGYTQQQVADYMQIDKSTYCGYETGKRQPDVAKIKQLSAFLGVSGDVLLETGFSNKLTPPIALTGDEQAIINAYRTADPLDKALVRRVLNVSEQETEANAG